MSALAKDDENTPKNAKSNNLVKTKRILNIKIKAKGVSVFTFTVASPCHLRHWL